MTPSTLATPSGRGRGRGRGRGGRGAGTPRTPRTPSKPATEDGEPRRSKRASAIATVDYADKSGEQEVRCYNDKCFFLFLVNFVFHSFGWTTI